MIFDYGLGGGAKLNFSVKAYSALPEAGKENEIAIITETPISRYVFSAAEPESMENGAVWIDVSGGNVSITIDKKGIITLFPAVCVQTVNETNEPKNAFVFQSGEWVQFAAAIPVYFDGGNQYEHITGGWTNEIFTSDSRSQKGAVTITETLNINTSNANQFGCLGTAEKVDLTNVDTIYYTCTAATGSPTLGVYEGTNLSTSSVVTTTLSVGNGSIDVSSLSGEYYIVLAVVASSSAPTRKASVSLITAKPIV